MVSRRASICGRFEGAGLGEQDFVLSVIICLMFNLRGCILKNTHFSSNVGGVLLLIDLISFSVHSTAYLTDYDLKVYFVSGYERNGTKGGERVRSLFICRVAVVVCIRVSGNFSICNHLAHNVVSCSCIVRHLVISCVTAIIFSGVGCKARSNLSYSRDSEILTSENNLLLIDSQSKTKGEF